MAADRLLMETYRTDIDNMTDKEKKAFAELLISRYKAAQAAREAYNKVSREKPVK